MAARLPDPATDRAADQLLDAMGMPRSDSVGPEVAGRVPWANGARLPDPAAEQTAERLLDAVGKTSD